MHRRTISDRPSGTEAPHLTRQSRNRTEQAKALCRASHAGLCLVAGRRGDGMPWRVVGIPGDAEYQELLAADPVGIAADHGVEQFLVGQACVAELPVVFEVAAGLGQDRGRIAAGRILVTGDDRGGAESRPPVERRGSIPPTARASGNRSSSTGRPRKWSEWPWVM